MSRATNPNIASSHAASGLPPFLTSSSKLSDKNIVAHPPGKLCWPANRSADSLKRNMPPVCPPCLATTHNPFLFRPMKNNGIDSLRTLASGRRGSFAAAAVEHHRDFRAIRASSRHPNGTMVRHCAKARVGWRQGILERIFVRQLAAPFDVTFGTAQSRCRHRSLRPVDEMPIERPRQPMPEALPFCFGTVTPGGSSTGTTLIEVSPIAQFTGPNVRLRAYEFETDRTPSS